MRRVEACGLVAALLLAPIAGDDPKPPPLHEAALETGVRLLTVNRETRAVATAVVLPLGYANDDEKAGSGLADFVAGFATFELPLWSAEVGPTTTLFRAALPVETLEASLTEFAQRLLPEGVDGLSDDRYNRYLDGRKAAPVRAVDRFRQAAFPLAREGAARSDATRRPKDALKRYLVERVGGEDVVVVLVSGLPAATLELAATHAFAHLPRAKGVAPRTVREAMPSAARRVAAPSGDDAPIVGLRLPWFADDQGDGAALATAWLESVTGHEALLRLDSEQGLLAGVAVDAAQFEGSAKALREALARAAGSGVPAAEAEAALARVAARAKAQFDEPATLAATLAIDAANGDDPLATGNRPRRLRERHELLAAELARHLRGAMPIEIAPAPARPGGP